MARRRNFKILAVLIAALIPGFAHAERVRQMVTVAGAPQNQLVGYGLVIGLPGTGDQTTQIPYTQQAITNMLSHEGITLPTTAFMQPNDVASVMVTARVPAFANQGSSVNVTVAAMGNATSLAGGVLLPTPLKGGNGEVYAQAQGPLLVSGFAAGAAGSSVRTDTPTVGQIPNGAIMSQSIPAGSITRSGSETLLLRHPSYGNAQKIADAIDLVMGAGTATAETPARIALHNRSGAQPVAFMARVLSLHVTPRQPTPTVIVDAQSGTIVMGGNVRLSPAIVSHGKLTVSIQGYNAVSQPNALAAGRTTGVRNATVNARQSGKGHVVALPKSTTLSQIAAALNKIGATPSDLIAIVEALKAAGALHAHLKVV